MKVKYCPKCASPMTCYEDRYKTVFWECDYCGSQNDEYEDNFELNYYDRELNNSTN